MDKYNEEAVAALEARVAITKADRRAILRALAREGRRLSRTPTDRQAATQGFLSSRAVERAEVLGAYERIRDIDPNKLPHRIVHITTKKEA